MAKKNRATLNSVPEGPIGSATKPIKDDPLDGLEFSPSVQTSETVIPAEPVSTEASPAAMPRIRPEPSEIIRVGAGGKLIVPRENLAEGLDDETEIDLASGQPKKIRKPNRREWIALSPTSELTTRLLIHTPKADGIEVEHYYVDEALRRPILDELKLVRVFVYFSYKTRTHGLWIVKVTPENPWYESLQQLFQQPHEFFAEKAIRVISDSNNSRYRVKFKPMPSEVTWPQKDTGELLGEALGPDHFITSADHPIYRDLIEGVELT